MRKRFSTDHLPFASLCFDGRINRTIIPARVKYFTQHWKLDAVAAVTVSIRDNKAYVIDGQHRVRAAMELGLGSTKTLCHVYRGLSLEEEAEKFLELNDARSVTPFDRYEVGLVAKDAVCLATRRILAGHGLKLANNKGEGNICAVSEILKVAERDQALLDQLCATIVETWGTRASALESVIISAVAQVLNRYSGELDRAILIKKLAGYRGGPAALLGDARGLKDYKPITLRRAAAEIIVDTYNRGRRSGALPPL